MSNVLKAEEYSRSLPNSRWLRKLLKIEVRTFRESMDVEWQKAVNAEPEYIQECKTKLEIAAQVLEQCYKSRKDVILTKIQWDGMHQILDDISTMGSFFDSSAWATNRTRLFDVSMRMRNWHSLDKYLDLFKVSEMDPSSKKQWRRCVNGVCNCSEEEMIEFPLVISPPTISEEEWRKCAEVGFIGYDTDFICPVCDKPINQIDHKDHKVYPTMKCFGCDKDGIEPYNIRWPIPFSIEQCRWLVYSLRHLIYEYEQCTDEDYRNDEGKIDERWKVQDALELKLMKNARHKLLTSKKTLFDPYTIAVLRHLCDNYLKLDESMLKNPSSVDHRRELAKCQDALSGIRETIDILPQTEKPLCYRCVGDKE